MKSYANIIIKLEVGSPLAAFLTWLSLMLPGVLVALAAIPVWAKVRHYGAVQAALGGINAAAAGLMAGAVVLLWQSLVVKPVLKDQLADGFLANPDARIGLCIVCGALQWVQGLTAPRVILGALFLAVLIGVGLPEVAPKYVH